MHFVYRYCPRCAQPMEVTLLFGRPRARCAACGFIQFQNPKVAVAVLLTDGPRVALVQRGVIPQIGFWSLPAGFMDFDEQPSAAALRELYEETGVHGEITALLDIFPMPQGGGIVITYAARLAGDGTITAGDDVSDARWFTPTTLPADLAFESTRSVLAHWVDGLHTSRQMAS